MDGRANPLYTRARYRIVAVAADVGPALASVTAYVVLSPAGEPLRHELSLERARDWVDALVEPASLRRAAAGQAESPARGALRR